MKYVGLTSRSYDKDDNTEKRAKKAEQEAFEKASRLCPRLLCNICGLFPADLLRIFLHANRSLFSFDTVP